MKIKTLFKIIGLFPLIIIFSLLTTRTSFAEELLITDNGSGSASTVNFDQQTNNLTTQNNTAIVDNSVITTANTGDNTITENTNGNAEIQTGDATTQTSVENQTNISTVQTICCGTVDSSLNISGNGDNTVSTINSTESDNSNVTILSTAKITNNISGYVNTGNNSANNNSGGDVTIKTGDINVITKVTNGPVNIVYVQDNRRTEASTVSISNNAAGSVNSIISDVKNERPVFVINLSDFKNLILWDLSTGENEVNGNSDGDVSIETGSIDLNVFIENFTNLSSFKGNCCRLPELPVPGDGEKTPGKRSTRENINPSPIGGFSGGSTLPAGAEAGAGGPGILGLSDTSGGSGSYIFLIGLLLLTTGIKLTGGELFAANLAGKRKIG